MPNNSLLINVAVGETRVALIEDGILSELYVERTQERSSVGNIYLGTVTRVLPGMQAAFIDIGLDRAAFLHVEDVVSSADAAKLADPGYDSSADSPSADAEENEGSTSANGARSRRSPRAQKRLSRKTPIRDVLKEGQPLMVQVSKGPISTKGARVTSHIALPGRYVVYIPTDDNLGISKRIGGDRERKRLKEVIESIKPDGGGLIVRTLAAGLTKKQLKADVGYLVKTWDDVLAKRNSTTQAPSLLYRDLDIILRTARDNFDEDIAKIVIDDPTEHERLREFLSVFLPHRVDDVELYDGTEPFFDEYGIESEIGRALARKVPLPSGGYVIIDQAEALTAIDVNTGRFTGREKTSKRRSSRRISKR